MARGWTVLVALAAALAGGQEATENLALFAPGGMPSAQASAPHVGFSAQKACDGKDDTGWVSQPGVYPVWLRVEWRLPVTLTELAFRPWSGSPYREVGAVGRYRLEVAAGDGWDAVAAGEAGALDQWVRHPLDRPRTTTAARLVVLSGAAPQVAVSELQAIGPKLVLPQDFEPGWQASWIWCEPSLVIPNRQPIRRYFRRSFTVADPKAVREAWLAACAIDRLTALWVNNRPFLADHSYAGGSLREAAIKEVPTDWLLAGENVISAAVDDLYEVGSRGLLAELLLIGADGTRTVIGTDKEWFGQEDQGVVPDWRKPGLKDSRWVPCTVGARPSTRWQWLWNLRHPTLAPADTIKVTALSFAPEQAKPGTEVTCRLTFEVDRPPAVDYAVVVRLGQPSRFTNHDFELWGAALPPEQVRTSAWQAGRHEVTLTVPLPPEAPRRTPVTVLLSRPEQAAGLVSGVAGWSADAYGLHGELTVDRGPVRAPAGGDFPGAEVRSLNGAATLHVAGRPIPPILWASSYGNYRRYPAYAGSGIKLFRPYIDGCAIAAPGEEEAYFKWWLAGIDQVIGAAVNEDPEILVVPIIHMDPNPEWLFNQPHEQSLSGRGELVVPLLLTVPDRGQVRPTFMSQAWRRDGAAGLTRLVKHLRAQPYAANVIGVWFFAGRAGENYWGGNERNLFVNEQGQWDALPRERWDAGDFSLAARLVLRDWLISKYGTNQALAAAWQRPGATFDQVLDPATFRKEDICDLLTWANKPAGAGSVRDPATPGVGTLPMDYYQCMSEAMIDTFAAWGKAVKTASDGKLIAGCYYGYALAQMLTAVPGYHGHCAVARAMTTPDLDGYVSPIDYGRRRAGSSVWGFNITDSLRLHDKLWLYEYDSRSHLADIQPKTFSEAETVEVFKRDVANALCRDSGWWWYEFGTDQRGARSLEWYRDPAIQAVAKRAREVYEVNLKLPDRGPAAEIAVFYHGESLAAQDLFTPTLPINVSISRMTLQDNLPHLGAPHDFYNLADIPLLARRGLLRQYKLCLFLNPFCLTATERGWVEQCRGGGRTLAWLWAPGAATAPSAAGPGSLSPDNVAKLIGMPVRWRTEPTDMVTRLTDAAHPLSAGLTPGAELAPKPFPPGATWERFGNQIAPQPFVDPKAAGAGVKVLWSWVVDGAVRPDMGALAVRDERRGEQGQASVYSALPYLSTELLRNLARFAGVHLYRDGGEILYANRHFVAVHTGAKAATGPLVLPRPSDVYDVFGRRQVARKVDRIELDVPPYSTVLYYLGDGAAMGGEGPG